MSRRVLEILQAVALCSITFAAVVLIDLRTSALGDEPTHVVDLRTSPPAEVAIHAALSQSTQIDFIDTPLSDAMQFLAEVHKIHVILDTQAMLDDGIGTDEPLNLQLKGVALQSALRLMLKPLGLTAIVQDEVLKVTTATVANSVMTTHVYDVRVLRKYDIESKTLVEVISRTVSPESWSDKKGSIQSLPGAIVIRNNAAVHVEVQELFSQLTRMTAKDTAVRSPKKNTTGGTAP